MSSAPWDFTILLESQINMKYMYVCIYMIEYQIKSTDKYNI